MDWFGEKEKRGKEQLIPQGKEDPKSTTTTAHVPSIPLPLPLCGDLSCRFDGDGVGFPTMGDAGERHHRHHLDDDVPVLSLRQLKVVSAVGRGANGVVFLVQNGVDGQLWALKVILRGNVEKKSKDSASKGGNDCRRISFEQQVLRQFDHRLLPKLRGALATDKVVGFAMDYCPGRDLNSLRRKQTEKMFSDDVIRYLARAVTDNY